MEYRKSRVKNPETGQWEKRWPEVAVQQAPEKASSKRAPETKGE